MNTNLPADVRELLRVALREDVGADGDITTNAIFNAQDAGAAKIRARQTGIISGVTLIAPFFEMVDDYIASNTPTNHHHIKTEVELCCADGDRLICGEDDVICKLSGSMRSILLGERTILNLLQRLSGIATETSYMIDTIKLNNYPAQLLDTRKTTPGLRTLEKLAVLHGGGLNHRFGLYDMILIKDTHVKRAGGVKNALTKALAWRGEKSTPLIEIEVRSIEELREVLPLNPDRIMLDNMNEDDIAKCIKERDLHTPKIPLEASGNVTLSSVARIAKTGVDFISCGAITHSAPALDINLTICSCGGR